MLATKKLCRLFFKAALKDFRPFFLLGLAVTVGLPLIFILRYGTSRNIMLGVGAAQLCLAVLLPLGGFFNLLGVLQQTWRSNRYRLLPVSSKQLYFSSLSLQTLAFILIAGVLALINFGAAWLIFKDWSQIRWDFSGNSSSLGFSLSTAPNGKFLLHLSSQTLLQAGLLLVDLLFSLVDLSFLLLLAGSLANLLTVKYRKLVASLGFIILLVLITAANFKLAHFFASDGLTFAFDLTISCLCMLGSVYLLKNWVETTK